MLFRRRKPQKFADKLRDMVWPRKGFTRPIRYFQRRIVRLTASPHAIAAGFTAGIIVSWTPVIGVHIVIAFVLAYLVGGNLLAATLGCLAAGNPFTYPFIWAITWEIGHLILGRESGDQSGSIDLPALFHNLDIWQLWGGVLEPMLLGAIPPAILSGLIVYSITFYGVRGFQRRRKARLMERARERMAFAAQNAPTV
ncbi:DUF2062 domain-containing protein [Rhizobium sp. HT1-10]|uniref:DUF2062 domain-containing protein n=1 Tax=Rhizobium sp. HT1-10 TaxID=3111638 RepID=UPI003C294C12